MAGSAKPNIAGLNSEGTYVINSFNTVASTTGASALFDGSVGSAGTLVGQFWYSSSDYVDITLNQKTTIWGVDNQDGTAVYNNPLNIKQWNGSQFVQYGTTNQLISPYTNWQILASNLPAGRYRFEYLTQKAIFTEWYLEGIYIDKFLISTENDIFSYKQGVSISTNAIPTMTSANLPSGIVTADSYNDGRDPYFAFDNNSSTIWYTYATPVPSGGHWIQYEFPTPKIIYQIKLASGVVSSGQTGLKDFQFYGSNDGSNYVLLHSGTQVIGTAVQTYTFNNTNKYKFYRLNALGSYYNTNNYIIVSTFEMYEMSGDVVYHLENASEQNFTQYGVNKNFELDLTKTSNSRSFLLQNSLVVGSGKVFKRTVDTSKVKINKISTQ